MSKETAWLRHREPLEKIWRLADARGQVLGRLATQISTILQGKHKPTYTDNMDCSDPVVVINARHFNLTGRKKYNKEYIHYTGYPGGLKRVPIHEVMDKRPIDPLYQAVRGMLPVNKLRAKRLNNLHIFPDEEHPFERFKPVPLPPSHAGERLGKGGPPVMYELEQWWLTHLTEAPDEVLDEVMREVHAEAPVRGVGLAEVLAFESDAQVSDQQRDAVDRYIASVDAAELNNAVIVPATM